MNFDEFQKQAPLYVLGALEPAELTEMEEAAKQFGQKAEDVIRECHALHSAFALSLQPAQASALLKERLMAMVRERQREQT
jgi:hypothetical protein